MLDNNRRIKGSKALKAGFDPGISNLASFLFYLHGQLKKIFSITMKGKRLLNQVRLFLAQRSIDRRHRKPNQSALDLRSPFGHPALDPGTQNFGR